MSYSAISVLAAFIPIFVYVAFLYWMDRYEREPISRIIIIFILGAILSSGLSFVANTLLSDIFGLGLSQAGLEYFSSGVIAPVVEEFNKALIVILFGFFFKRVNNLTNGLLYGAVVGLSFAFAENIIYFHRIYAAAGEFEWLRNIYTRSMFTAGVHSVATATFGGFYAYARFKKGTEKILLWISGLLIAIMIHSFWNSFLTIGQITQDPFLVTLVFIAIPCLYLFMFILFQLAVLADRNVIRKELEQEVQEHGTLPKEHIPYIYSYLKRSQKHWLSPQIAKKAYIMAAIHLAFLRDYATKDSPEQLSRYQGEIESTRNQIKNLLSQGA